MIQIPVMIERASETPIQEQLVNGIGKLIVDGTLRPEMRLPASRALSRQLKVSRNTVRIAYSNLISQGYLECRGTGGTFVCGKLPDDALHASAEVTPSSTEVYKTPPRVFQAPAGKSFAWEV